MVHPKSKSVVLNLAICLAFLVTWSCSLKPTSIGMLSDSANAGGVGYQDLNGAMFNNMLAYGQLIWVGYNTYRVRTGDLANQFARVYGYCPSDSYEIARRYGAANNSRFWFRAGEWMFFIRN